MAPTTETNYTLIGPKHAWRCKKRVVDDGGKLLEWYCPACWRADASLSPSAKKRGDAP